MGANVTAYHNSQLEPLKDPLKIFPGKLQAELHKAGDVRTGAGSGREYSNHGIWPCVPVVELTLESGSLEHFQFDPL